MEVITLRPPEPNGGVQGSLQDHHHVPVVPELLHHPLPQQEGLVGGEDHALTPRRLLPRVQR